MFSAGARVTEVARARGDMHAAGHARPLEMTLNHGAGSRKCEMLSALMRIEASFRVQRARRSRACHPRPRERARPRQSPERELRRQPRHVPNQAARSQPLATLRDMRPNLASRTGEHPDPTRAHPAPSSLASFRTPVDAPAPAPRALARMTRAQPAIRLGARGSCTSSSRFRPSRHRQRTRRASSNVILLTWPGWRAIEAQLTPSRHTFNIPCFAGSKLAGKSVVSS